MNLSEIAPADCEKLVGMALEVHRLREKRVGAGGRGQKNGRGQGAETPPTAFTTVEIPVCYHI